MLCFNIKNIINTRKALKISTEAAVQRCSQEKVFRKYASKFTGEPPCRGVISVKLQSNFIEFALQHGCSSVNLLNIFRAHFPKNISGGLLLFQANWIFQTGDILFQNLSISQNFSFAKFQAISHKTECKRNVPAKLIFFVLTHAQKFCLLTRS